MKITHTRDDDGMACLMINANDEELRGLYDILQYSDRSAFSTDPARLAVRHSLGQSLGEVLGTQLAGRHTRQNARITELQRQVDELQRRFKSVDAERDALRERLDKPPGQRVADKI